jgi:hypothetical protein
MKIDPTGKIPHFQQPAIDNSRGRQGISGFDAVLQQTLQNSAPAEKSRAASIGRTAAANEPVAVPHGAVNAAEAYAEKLLTRLEDYQKMLGDPGVGLKEIQPVVEQMKKDALGTRALIADMPDGHPLRTIVQDIVASIDRESDKFNAGHYVDE